MNSLNRRMRYFNGRYDPIVINGSDPLKYIIGKIRGDISGPEWRKFLRENRQPANKVPALKCIERCDANMTDFDIKLEWILCRADFWFDRIKVK